MFDGKTHTGAKVKGRRYPRETLTEGECKALITQLSRRSSTGIRNRALLVVLWRAGLRVSEALSLRLADLNPDTGEISVLWAKGNKRRVVPLDSGAVAEVLRWRDRRETLGFNGHRPFFCTLTEGKRNGQTLQKGEPLSSEYVRQLLRRLADKSGIEKRVTPHAFRHTYASELEREGNNHRKIQYVLGHESLATTERYLGTITAADIERAPLKLDD